MHILKLQCQDQPGIVADVATTLAEHKLNIEESSQFHDTDTGKFFMRVLFSGENQNFDQDFLPVAQKYKMSFEIVPKDKPTRTLILVSKEDHCLNDLLYRWRKNDLNIEIVGVVSNHKAAENLVKEHGLEFHYLPITKDTKESQEEQIRNLIEKNDVELILLARYMQILTAEFCEEHLGKIINIHHSFLPGFKGANPYHQAYNRGVKIIGATAHFVTADLDEGPIIEQQVSPVDHRYDPNRMKKRGRDIECLVFARATELFCEHRIFMNDNRTVIL